MKERFDSLKSEGKERFDEFRSEGKERFDSLKSESKERFNEFRSESKERLEELKVEGDQLAGKVREIIQEGKARKIIIKKGERVLAEFPLIVGVGGTTAAVVLAPTLAAVAAIGALVSDVSVVIHRHDSDANGEEVREVSFTEIDE